MRRAKLLDTLRGFSIILVIIHHALYDFIVFLDAPQWLESIRTAIFFGAYIFILLCGICCNYSRSNLKRGVKTLALAMIITLVTGVMNMVIRFGILHFLAFCMIFYAFTEKMWKNAPRLPTMATALLLFLLTYKLQFGVVTEYRHLWMFGLTYRGFYSSDYFPILPWVFIFVIGVILGQYIKEDRAPDAVYDFEIKPLSFIGRHSLVIYIVHQPILYGLCMILAKLQ